MDLVTGFGLILVLARAVEYTCSGLSRFQANMGLRGLLQERDDLPSFNCY